MNIPQADADLFFKLHPALLQYINQRLKIFPKIKTAEKLRLSGIENVAQVRAELWQKPEYIADFVLENPNNLVEDELAIVASWKHFIKGRFYVLRHLKKYSIFLTEAEPTRAYGVCSINTPLNEMPFKTPIYLEAVLLPFRDRIIYDGILHPYSVTFGPGFRSGLNEAYREAKNKLGVIEQITVPNPIQ